MQNGLNRLMSLRGILSIIMVVSLFLPCVGGGYDYQNMFQLTQQIQFAWVIIILVFTNLVLRLVNIDKKIKEKVCIVISVIVLFLNRVILAYVGLLFSRISLGWKMISILCIIQIIISVVCLKKKQK